MMKTRILQAVLICLAITISSVGQQPISLRLERSDFLSEVLSSKPLLKTPYYDSNTPGSYQISKTDIVRGLPEAAKNQNLDLRGLLMIGPYGPVNAVFAYVFLGEKSSIRVNQLTVAQGRFTYKSTGRMTPTQYQSFLDDLLKANVLVSGLPGNDVRSEARYEIVLARWSKGNLDSHYGSSITPRPGANVNDFGKRIASLLRSLAKTYPAPVRAPMIRPSPTPPRNKPPVRES